MPIRRARSATFATLLVVALAAALVVVVVAAAGLVLAACGLRLPFAPGLVASCDLRSVTAQDDVLAERDALLRQIAGLERDLAGQTCAIVLPEPEPEPVLDPEALDARDRDAFEAADLAAMEGCWMLDSDYATVDRRTGRETHWREWELCFDTTGQGRETMRSTRGDVCDGAVTARFGAPGRFSVIEPDNLQCSGGFFIYRREISCVLDAQGRAQCDTYQPETGSRGDARLRRASRGP
jgi:hypothetical protein